MTNLPLAAFVATRLVERQFDDRPLADRRLATPTRPVVPASQPVRRTRMAVAEALVRAARVVAPDSYRVAH